MRVFMSVLFSTLALLAQPIVIDGGAAPMENLFKPLKTAFENKTGLALELRENGPEQSLLALNRGEVAAAAAGLSPDSWFELMRQKGHGGLDPAAFKAQKIGFDKINVFYHADLWVPVLDKAQLKGLFTGRITNWKQVQGPDLPVILVLGTKVPGTNKVFQEQVLDREPYASSALQVGTTPEIMDAIAKTPGAIGIGPLSALKNQKVSSPVTPEVGRPITLLTKGQAHPGVEALVAFLLGEGQALIAK